MPGCASKRADKQQGRKSEAKEAGIRKETRRRRKRQEKECVITVWSVAWVPSIVCIICDKWLEGIKVVSKERERECREEREGSGGMRGC